MTMRESTSTSNSGRSRRSRRTNTSKASPAAPIPNSKSMIDARAKFAAGVSRGVSVLMRECGYSRERAQAALLREIAGGDHSSPADNEVFKVMSTHGLGIEDAATALTVSKALQRVTAERGISLIEAIDDLTSKLSAANLSLLGRESTSPVPTSSSTDDVVSMRIQPVPSIERVVAQTRQKTTIPLTSATSTTAPTTRKPKATSKNVKQKGAIGTRKRSVDDINMKSNPENTANKKEESPATFNKRERSDSLSEVVNAKFADQSTQRPEDVSPSQRITPSQSSAAVRSKRARGEEAEATQSAMKRSRTAGEH